VVLKKGGKASLTAEMIGNLSRMQMQLSSKEK
jgi:hypothetical protein